MDYKNTKPSYLTFRPISPLIFQCPVSQNSPMRLVPGFVGAGHIWYAQFHTGMQISDWSPPTTPLHWSSLKLLFMHQNCVKFQSILKHYTLSHPENNRDVTERAHGYTLQDTSFMRQSRCSFLNSWENTQVVQAMTSVFTRSTLWRHGRSRGETKYWLWHFCERFWQHWNFLFSLCFTDCEWCGQGMDRSN